MKRALTKAERLLLWLNTAVGHHVDILDRMLSWFSDAEEIYLLAKARNMPAFQRWGEEFANRVCDLANEREMDKSEQWLRDHDTDILIQSDGRYPALLRETPNAPALLYIRGELATDPLLPIGIVGMRKNTAYGEAVAQHLAEELVRAGGTIISGMALGIDAFSAMGALKVKEAALPTVAVLGSGIDVIYPSQNARLYHEIIARGAVVSEFCPGTRPHRQNFPIRNRIISGLSRGVVVVEASERSGSSITAGYALEQGRDVFAVPGRITDHASVGPNGMIQRGEAKPVFCAADILVEYGMHGIPEKKQSQPDLRTLSALEREIVELLLRGERSADELCEILSIPIAEVNSTLTSLQFSEIIKQLPGRVFGI